MSFHFGAAADPNGLAFNLHLDESTSPVRPAPPLAPLTNTSAVRRLRIHHSRNERRPVGVRALRTSRRACHRHVNKKPMPAGNVGTTAAATKVSSTMRVLSSANKPPTSPRSRDHFAFATGAPRAQIQELTSLGFVERGERRPARAIGHR